MSLWWFYSSFIRSLWERPLDLGEEDRPVGNQRCEHLSPESSLVTSDHKAGFTQAAGTERTKLNQIKQMVFQQDISPPYWSCGTSWLRIRAAAEQNQGFWWVQLARGPKSGAQDAQLADFTPPFHWLLLRILRSSSLTWPVRCRTTWVSTMLVTNRWRSVVMFSFTGQVQGQQSSRAFWPSRDTCFHPASFAPWALSEWEMTPAV